MLELGDDQLVQLLDQLRRPARLAQAPLQHPAGDLRRGADQLALVGGGELDPAALEEVFLGAGPDRLGIEQQAVVVEDDGVGQAAAISPAPPRARSRAPRRPRRSSFSSASPSYGVGPLVTIASRPPALEGQLRQAGDRVDGERGADAEHQLGPLRRAPSARAIASAGSSSPKRTTSGLTAPPQPEQIATPSLVEELVDLLEPEASRAGRAGGGLDRAVHLDHVLASPRPGAGGRCSG